MKNSLKFYIITLLFSLTSILNAAEKVALVIGNNAYSQAPLKNPINDASAIAKVLQKIGFDVVPAYDVNRAGMEDALETFGKKAENAKIAMIYYAGHAIQVDGVNYLVPANTPVKHRRDIRKLMNLNELVLEVKQASGLGLVMLDACRDNPFTKNITKSLGRSVGGRGLARIEDTPDNILIGFATKKNAIAADGKGKHSPYANALLKYLPEKNLEIRFLFGKVKDEVQRNTGNIQQPFTYGSLGGNQWFLVEGIAPPPRFKEPKMVSIRGGCYQMGQSASEKKVLIKEMGKEKYKKYSGDEKQHKSCVEDFSLGQYEVTVGEFRQFINATAYRTEAEKSPAKGCRTYDGKANEWQWSKNYDWQTIGFKQGENHPVACVSWNDAMAYIKWLKKETGKPYRLPTEAEWEYAARAGSKTPFSTGNQISSRQANFDGNYTFNGSKKGKYLGKTSAVGSYSANKNGLYDMHGNILEWTCSAYVESYDGSELLCAKDSDSRSRVLRGGSWYSLPWILRSAFRFRLSATYRDNYVGFRISRTY